MDQTVRSLFSRIGFITVVWAQLEGNLDAINRTIFLFAGGEAIEDRVPESLNRRLRFMRQCHAKLPKLQALQPQADALIDRVHSLKQRRHDLIHGIATSMPKGDLLEILVISRDRHNREHTRLETIKSADLDKIFHDIEAVLNLCEQHLIAVGNTVFAEGD